jgi:hypothetical protein
LRIRTALAVIASDGDELVEYPALLPSLTGPVPTRRSREHSRRDAMLTLVPIVALLDRLAVATRVRQRQGLRDPFSEAMRPSGGVVDAFRPGGRAIGLAPLPLRNRIVLPLRLRGAGPWAPEDVLTISESAFSLALNPCSLSAE